jgi:xanthine dehydrogenase small subunit
MSASLELRAPGRTRRVPIEAFYRGYKDIDLAPDELIAAIEVPLPRRGEDLRLYKMSRRRALDIASFTAAVLVRRDGAGDIAEARIAYGGVGPTVTRVRAAERALAGEPYALDTFRRAGEIAAREITPWTDVRGSESYRRRLAENVLVKFFYDTTEPMPGDLDLRLTGATPGSRTGAGVR